MSHAIELKGVSFFYSAGTPHQVAALDKVDLTIEKGEFVGIIGQTGSGKSTLISHFNGLLKPAEGNVIVDGVDIWSSKEATRNSRFKVGLCFQYPEYQLFEETVAKDIAFGPKNMKLSDEEVKQRVARAAQYVGLKEELLEKSPFDLSGGEKRRAAIAGVMAMEPEVLVFDEPAAGLDPAGRKDLIKMIKNYREETGCTVIFVSHSMEDIAQTAERIIAVCKGKIAMDGTVDEVFSKCDELTSIGLNVPAVTQVFSRLNKMGYDVPPNVYSVEQGKEIILSLLKGGAVNDK